MWDVGCENADFGLRIADFGLPKPICELLSIVLSPGSWILNSKYTLLHIRGRNDRRERENSLFS